MADLLEFKNVCKNFGDKQILNNVSFKLGKNKIVGLIGQNGSGKTTIFKLINDLFTVSSGEVLFEDKHIGVESKKDISYLPERTYLQAWTKRWHFLKHFMIILTEKRQKDF